MGVKCILQDQALDLADVGGSNPNLLDNWYFGDPEAIIDQRQGYVVPPGHVYAIPSATTLSGTTDRYYAVDRIGAAGYPYITIDGVQYVTNPGTEVRGYANESGGYSIDRWSLGHGQVIELLDNGLKLIHIGNDGRAFRQHVESPEKLSRKTVTVSVLVDAVSGDGRGGMFLVESGESTKLADLSAPGLYVGTRTLSSDLTSLVVNVNSTGSNVGSWIALRAVKLELGSVQTLAHQDENGNWVLNDPPPDKGTELAKCQRYYVPLDHNSGFYGGYHYPSKTLYLNMPLSVNMRVAPTVINPDGPSIIVRSSLGDVAINDTASIYAKQQNIVQIALPDSEGKLSALTKSEPVYAYLATSGYAFSADL